LKRQKNPTPDFIEKALKDVGLLEKFRGLAYSHQREYHRWIGEAKRPETRAARITKMTEMLAAGKQKLG